MSPGVTASYIHYLQLGHGLYSEPSNQMIVLRLFKLGREPTGESMKILRLKFAYICLLTAITTACAAPDPNKIRNPSDSSDTVYGLDTAIETTTSEILNDAMWFTLDASATIEKGFVTSTALILSTFIEPSEEPICVSSVNINSYDTVDPPDEIIDTWLSVDWDLSTLPCSAASRLPEWLMLGMGELHKDLEPYLSSSGVTNPQGGAYISYGELDDTQEERVYAYGYLSYTGSDGTTHTEPTSDSAIPDDLVVRQDGVWGLHGVFLFPLKPI